MIGDVRRQKHTKQTESVYVCQDNQHALQVATTAIRDDGFAVCSWMRVVPTEYYNVQKSRSVKYTIGTAQVQGTRKQRARTRHCYSVAQLRRQQCAQ